MKTLFCVSLLAAAAIVPSVARAQVVVVDGYGPSECCWNPRPRRPVFTFGAELGVGHLNEGNPFAFTTSTGTVIDAGGVWGLRAGVDFARWLGIEGRYVGGFLPGNSLAPNVGYILTGGEMVVRLALPTPFIRPYIFAGIGVYDFSLTGDDASRTASQLTSTTQAGIPMGVGIELLLMWHLGIAIEGAYRFQLNESFSNNDNISGSDISTLTAVVRFRL